MNNLSVAFPCTQFFSGKCFSLLKHLLYQTVEVQITGTLRNHFSYVQKQFLMAEWILWTNNLWSTIYVPQHFLTHWIFPMHHKLSFSSVKWSRNRSKLMADLTHPLCWCSTCVTSHLEALQLVLASPPQFKKDVFLVFSAKFLVKV